METLILGGIIIVNLRNMHLIVNESKANLFKIPSGRIIHEAEVTKRGKRFVPGRLEILAAWESRDYAVTKYHRSKVQTKGKVQIKVRM